MLGDYQWEGHQAVLCAPSHGRRLGNPELTSQGVTQLTPASSLLWPGSATGIGPSSHFPVSVPDSKLGPLTPVLTKPYSMEKSVHTQLPVNKVTTVAPGKRVEPRTWVSFGLLLAKTAPGKASGSQFLGQASWGPAVLCSSRGRKKGVEWTWAFPGILSSGRNQPSASPLSHSTAWKTDTLG